MFTTPISTYMFEMLVINFSKIKLILTIVNKSITTNTMFLGPTLELLMLWDHTHIDKHLLPHYHGMEPRVFSWNSSLTYKILIRTAQFLMIQILEVFHYQGFYNSLLQHLNKMLCEQFLFSSNYSWSLDLRKIKVCLKVKH